MPSSSLNQLESPSSSLKGVGPKTASALKKLDIFTLFDLLNHYPRHYLDYSKITPISHLQVGEPITIKAQVLSFYNLGGFYRSLQKVSVADSTGKITISWFNQPYLKQQIKKGQTYYFSGLVSYYQGKPTLSSPDWELYQENPLHTARLIPIYPETRGVNSKWFRKNIHLLLPLSSKIPEFLPASTLKNQNLAPLNFALQEIHRPNSSQTLAQAQARLRFNEIFCLQITSQLRRHAWQKKHPARPLTITPKIEKLLQKFIQNIPFTLTPSQQKILKTIKRDLSSTKILTNRLIQGDTGSGKTILAFLAAYLVYLNGQQTVILAPTEILAQQHYREAQKFFKKYKLSSSLITSQHKSQKKADLLIGTHALFHQKKLFSENLGLLVIDEQHRFGVKQRAFLANSSSPPHLLTMTATPIPRSTHLVFLGELNISTLTDLPPGRQKVSTFTVAENKRDSCYTWVEKHLKKNKSQALIVCPFIDESETMKTVKAATLEYERLAKKIFPKLKLALLHGKTTSQEKQKIISRLKKGSLDILVATPIVEVGLDLSGLSVIIIESANRFGLATLHQLRGRVGRNSQKSYCFLFTDQPSARLNFLQNHHLGQEIAEYDLKTRGPSQPFSLSQHGFPHLKIASSADYSLAKKVQQVIKELPRPLKNFLPWELRSLPSSHFN